MQRVINEVCSRIKVKQALDIVENTDFKVIWLRKRRYYSHLIRFEISKNIEMSRDGSDLMVNGYINEGITAP